MSYREKKTFASMTELVALTLCKMSNSTKFSSMLFAAMNKKASYFHLMYSSDSHI